MNKEISIVIPTYNRAHLVGETIESCLNQTKKCEIIVCDHGSTDDTPKVVNSFGQKIKYIRREKDFGPHFCWLEGIINTTNEWVHLQFDDDMIAPNFIQKCTEYTSLQDVGMIFTDAIVFAANSEINKIKFLPFDKSGIYSSKIVFNKLLETVISPGACVYRKSLFLDSLFINNIPFAKAHYRGVGPDILVGLFASVNYPKTAYINEHLAFFRAHDGSITIDAEQSDIKREKIWIAYEESRKLAVLLLYDKKYKIANMSLSLKKLSDFFRIKIYRKLPLKVKKLIRKIYIR